MPTTVYLVCVILGRLLLRVDPPKQESICRKLSIYSYMFKLQSPTKSSSFDVIHVSRHFFHFSKVFELVNFDAFFGASVMCCFISSTLAKCFPLRTFFIEGNKKSCSRWDPEKRGGEAWCHALFGQTLLNTQCDGAGALVNHPSWNGQTSWKSLKKKSLWSQAQPLETTPTGTLIPMGF